MHAVADSSAIDYAKSTTRLLHDVKMHKMPFDTVENIDKTIEVPISGTALYRAKLRPKNGTAPSVLFESPPFYKHWIFYTAVGSVVIASATAIALSGSGGGGGAQTSPSGNILVNLP